MAQAAPHTMVLRRERSLPLTSASFWRSAGWISLLALITGLVCLIYLIATSSVLSAGYDIQRAERERSEWLAKNEQLQLELAKVRSLAWIEAQSTTRLGMVRPETVQYVRLDTPAVASDAHATAVAQQTAPSTAPGETPGSAHLSPARSALAQGSR